MLKGGGADAKEMKLQPGLNRGLRRAVAGLAAILMCQTLQGQEVSPNLLPPKVAAYSLARTTNFNQSAPGLGRSFQYFLSGPGSPNISVYVYNKNLNAIPDGIESEVLRAELHIATTDVLRARAGARTTEADVSLQIGGMAFKLAAFELENEGVPMQSFLFMSAKDNAFIKVRATFVRDSMLPSALESLSDFLSAISMRLGSRADN